MFFSFSFGIQRSLLVAFLFYSILSYPSSVTTSFTKLSFLLIATIQLKQAGSPAAPASVDQTQEVGRLRGEMEKKTLLYEEELARREAQHGTELKALRKELRDAESQHLTLQKEILMLKDKLDKTRRERYFISFSSCNSLI